MSAANGAGNGRGEDARKPASAPRELRDAERPNPMLRLALRREEAAATLGVSDETFDRYVRAELPVVRIGSLRLYPVAALEAWLQERASAPIEDLER